MLPGFEHIPSCHEDGATFRENAFIKAQHYACSSKTRGWIFADDSGLEVDALNGEPGVRSARYSGRHGDDAANNRLLLNNLRGINDRTARFVCAVALFDSDLSLYGIYSGAVEGVIVDDPRGSSGFGYDPLFYYPPFGQTFGELGDEKKFSVSHRGQALRAMLADLLHR